ncbi:hypothetical protein K490DRAFT_65621 [Saccharata proteae CBS 121410]|uniref:Uncharacterized protein n=1 Tax=Saccharata proteae CBS 121410 TaxID=1314787 RepID=A0A9P4LX55_9PEZI|nr:hypothetical protein K490DRAFT_65621 [Saccharata proteae CBS 121410]
MGNNSSTANGKAKANNGTDLLIAIVASMAARTDKQGSTAEEDRMEEQEPCDPRQSRPPASPLRYFWTPMGPPPSAEVVRQATAPLLPVQTHSVPTTSYNPPPGESTVPTLPTFYQFLWEHIVLVHPATSAVKFGGDFFMPEKEFRKDWIKILACGCIVPLEELVAAKDKVNTRGFISNTCPGWKCRMVLYKAIKAHRIQRLLQDAGIWEDDESVGENEDGDDYMEDQAEDVLLDTADEEDEEIWQDVEEEDDVFLDAE